MPALAGLQSLRRYVPTDCQRIEWHYSPNNAECVQQYCYLKLYRRRYAERRCGPDVFTDDGWASFHDGEAAAKR